MTSSTLEEVILSYGDVALFDLFRDKDRDYRLAWLARALPVIAHTNSPSGRFIHSETTLRYVRYCTCIIKDRDASMTSQAVQEVDLLWGLFKNNTRAFETGAFEEVKKLLIETLLSLFVTANEAGAETVIICFTQWYVECHHLQREMDFMLNQLRVAVRRMERSRLENIILFLCEKYKSNVFVEPIVTTVAIALVKKLSVAHRHAGLQFAALEEWVRAGKKASKKSSK